MEMTVSPVGQRDYSLVGADSRRAVEIGLASAEWYHSEVPRNVMKELMQRTRRSGHPRHRCSGLRCCSARRRAASISGARGCVCRSFLSMA